MIRQYLADAFWIVMAPLRFAGIVIVCLIGGVYFGMLCACDWWRKARRLPE